MNEMETKLYDLMAQVEGNKGGNNEEAMEEIGNILTLLEVFHWEDYKRIVIAKFNVPADHFLDDPELMGECDTCDEAYDVSSRDGRCGDCGDCSKCCQH